MTARPDPKPAKARRKNRPRRLVDPAAVQAVRLRGGACASCGRRAESAHHVIPRGGPHFGDDVDANIVLLCGDGTRECHGAAEGSPFVRLGKRWTPEDVRRRIGQHLILAQPQTVAYAVQKLGLEPGIDFLRRRYHVEPSAAHVALSRASQGPH